MFTETELRDALRHSAARADCPVADCPVADCPATDETSEHAHDPVVARRSRPRARVLLPAGAAAAVLAVVIGAALLGTSGPAERTPSPGHSSRPTTVRPAHPAKVAVSVNDLVHVGFARASYDIHRTSAEAAANAEYVTADAFHGKDLALVAMPASANFDPGVRFRHARRVTVLGTRGYFGDVVLWPADGHRDVNTVKHGGPSQALGWQTPDGTWLFLTSGDYDVRYGVDALRTAARQLRITLATDRTRVPYRLGFVPRGTRLESASTSGANPVSDVRLSGHGGRYLDMNISGYPGAAPQPSGGSDLPVSIGGGGPTVPGGESGEASRFVDGYTVEVTGFGYGAATVHRVLRTLQLADLTSGVGDWSTLRQAFG